MTVENENVVPFDQCLQLMTWHLERGRMCMPILCESQGACSRRGPIRAVWAVEQCAVWAVRLSFRLFRFFGSCKKTCWGTDG